ncbi:MAG: tetratricopeptide repeat protein [Verrucomicrobia bacterium]|nr:tetratricopeptide repeat protein [Verrucomicrobiota bacterium]
MRSSPARQGIAALAVLVALLATTECLASEALTYNNAGVEALDAGDYETAIRSLRAALDLEPGDQTIRRNLTTAYNNYGVTLLEGGDFQSAVAALKAGLDIAPNDEQALSNLARAYNSRGVALIDAENYTAAESYLLEAIRHQPAEPVFRANLSVAMTHYARAFYDAHDRGMAFLKLREALQYDPQNTGAMVLLSQICYERQELGWALYYLRAARQLEPQRLASLAKRIAQLEHEAGVEGAFEHQDHGVFDIRYDKGLKNLDLKALRAHLSDAYYTVGGAFGYYPRQKIIVIVYEPEDFARLRSQPDWVSGFYDGKIRVPSDGTRSAADFRRLIRHEYTHAVVGALSKDKCAVWLNEGLAKLMEYWGDRAQGNGMPMPLLKERLRTGTWMSFADLQGEFLKIEGRDAVALAYEESYTIAAYLLDTYGMWKVKRMLAGYAAGDDTPTILARELRRTPEQFEQDWLRALKRQFR